MWQDSSEMRVSSFFLTRSQFTLAVVLQGSLNLRKGIMQKLMATLCLIKPEAFRELFYPFEFKQELIARFLHEVHLPALYDFFLDHAFLQKRIRIFLKLRMGKVRLVKKMCGLDFAALALDGFEYVGDYLQLSRPFFAHFSLSFLGFL